MRRILFTTLLVLATTLGCLAQNKVNAMVDLKGLAGGGSLPKPAYKSQETGIVVVKVVVSPEGKVIEAVPGYIGSDTISKTLLSAAREAALKARFRMADGTDGNRTGTITYGFGVELNTDNVQGKGVDEDGFISIADLLDYHENGEYRVRATFFGISDEEILAFYVQQRADELLPVLLRQTQEAKEFYHYLMSIPQGTLVEITVRGSLTQVDFGNEKLKALVDADILSATSDDITLDGIQFQAEDPNIIPPKFQGQGTDFFSKWVNRHLVYPKEAKRKGIQGTVLLSFTIDKTGNLTQIKVLKSAEPDLDEEAVRVVSQSPKWTPASLTDGTPVNAQFTFPINFRLNR